MSVSALCECLVFVEKGLDPLDQKLFGCELPYGF